MKFVALLLISAVAADAEPKKAAAGETCADPKKAVCADTDCCGTVTDLGADPGTVTVSDASVKFKGIAKTVCMTKPAADTLKETGEGDKKKPGVGTVVEVVKKVDEAGTKGEDGYVAPVVKVEGTFLCNAAADADAGAASYMTVGAAAIIAAATLLQ